MHPVQRTLLTRLVDTSYRSPWKVLAVALVVGAVATVMSMQLGFRGDFIELLPAKTEEVLDLRAVEKSAGGGGYLIVQLLGGTREQRREAAAALAPRLEREQDVVRYVEFHFDVAFFKDRALLALPTERLTALEKDLGARIDYEKKIANPLYVDLGEEPPPDDFTAIEKKYAGDVPQGEYIESKSGEELYLLVKPSQLAADLDFNRALINRVKTVSADVLQGFPQLKAAFTGAYVIRVEEDELMQSDLTRAATLAMLVSLGIILLASRRPVALVIVAAPVVIGIAATFAFAWVLIGHLNPVTGFLGAILIGLGIEYGVHLSMRYWEERVAHEPLEAMREAVLGTFAGAVTSAATNAAAFFVLVFAQFEAFKQFGQIAAFGVLATVLAAYLMGPAVLFIAERIRPARRPRDVAAARAEAASEATGGFTFSTPVLVTVLAVIAGCAVYSVSVARHVQFETNLRSLKGDSPATNLDVHIAEQLGVIMVPAPRFGRQLGTCARGLAHRQRGDERARRRLVDRPRGLAQRSGAVGPRGPPDGHRPAAAARRGAASLVARGQRQGARRSAAEDDRGHAVDGGGPAA
jgi:predicted RND superfamily exporter protein